MIYYENKTIKTKTNIQSLNNFKRLLLLYSRFRLIETPVNMDNHLIGTILQLQK